MHWGQLWAKNSEANTLTHPEVCPISLQPELKACAVRALPVSEVVEDAMRSQAKIPQRVKSRS